MHARLLPILLPGALAMASTVFAQTQNPPASQENQDEVVRVSTTLVTVTVNARDRHGKVIRDLQRGDFHLEQQPDCHAQLGGCGPGKFKTHRHV